MGNLSQVQDSALLHSFCRNGDQAAFTQLVERHHAMMYRTALRLLGNKEDAYDALQAALIIFAKRAPELSNRQTLGPWLHRVVLLECKNLNRKRTLRTRRETEAMKQHKTHTPPQISPLLADLDQAIDSLSPKDRSAVVLHHLEGQTFPSIAEQLGGSAESWRKRCSRALTQLSRKLGKQGTPVAAITLTTLLAQQQAKSAPLQSHVVQTLTREALSYSSTSALNTTGTLTLLLMKSKFILIAAFVGGALFSAAWNPSSQKESAANPKSSSQVSNHSDFTHSQGSRLPSFNLESLLAYIRRVDTNLEEDRADESTLRLLMFSVPEEHLAAVLVALNEVSHRERFNPIVAALYARWAEVDPTEAWASAQEEERFLTQARQGVILTWLARDSEQALAALIASPHRSNLNILTTFLKTQVQHSPRDSALFVDQVAAVWPEADLKLFPQVAKEWALEDPESAAEWVASHHDVKRRDQILKSISRDASRTRGLKGMAITNLIENPKQRSRAREQAAHWLGISLGSYLWSDYYVNNGYGLAKGYPSDWTTKELRTFANGAMLNYSKNYDLFLQNAETEEQRQSLHYGLIGGASVSHPAIASQSVSALDPALLENDPLLQKTLASYILSWHEEDPTSAKKWLEQQPSSEKTRIMEEALR